MRPLDISRECFHPSLVDSSGARAISDPEVIRILCFSMCLGGFVFQAKSELKRSAVADNVSGKSRLSDVRTSSGMFIPKGKV